MNYTKEILKDYKKLLEIETDKLNDEQTEEYISWFNDRSWDLSIEGFDDDQCGKIEYLVNTIEHINTLEERSEDLKAIKRTLKIVGRCFNGE